MAKKSPNTPDGGKEGKKITANPNYEIAISETLGEGPSKELKNWAAKQIREMIIFKGADMSTISSEDLQKKLLEVYKEGEFNLKKEEVLMIIKVFADNFCKRREELKNKSMKERKLYLLGSIAQYYLENGEEEKAETFENIVGSFRENEENSILDPESQDYDQIFDPENQSFDAEEMYNFIK